MDIISIIEVLSFASFNRQEGTRPDAYDKGVL
jgi:hypothetical protein